MEKHKHYNEIIAFAEGKEIEGRKLPFYDWKSVSYPQWFSDWEYRVKDPYKELKEAKAAGKTIEYNYARYSDKPQWAEIPDPKWIEAPEYYRIKSDEPKKDPYQELRDAHRAGKTIQYNPYMSSSIDISSKWRDMVSLSFVGPIECYRIKPEEQQPTCSQNQQAPEPMFAKAKVGDKVFSLQYGEGAISSIESPRIDKTHDRIRVTFKNNCACAYELSGYRYHTNDATQDLYWDKPQIIAPEKPKKMKKVEKQVWVNTGFDGPEVYTGKEIFKTENLAQESAQKHAVNLDLRSVPATLTYEIEED